MRAPISGRLAAVNVQTGGPVDGMTAPFVIENTASFMLDLQIPERLASKVHPGMAVELMGKDGKAVRGTIVSVGSSLDPASRSLIAKARIATSPDLVSGKSVMAMLKGEVAATGVSIPATAVTRLNGKDVVFVHTERGFVARNVTLGGRHGDRVTLIEGIQPGERVAITGISELKVILDEG